ncbi:MAG: hypothetical protein K6A63_08485, partial [Acholeplasmatales bacterium]|nr:hypothetical protein [Acholeplasmatales bacterium]
NACPNPINKETIMIFQILISKNDNNPSAIIIVSLLMGLGQALYSVPINLIFTFGDKKTNVGKFMIATNIGKLIFTLVSGFILSSTIKNSFLILSIASIVFYILCFIPLIFAYKELVEKYKAYKEEPKEEIHIDKWFILFHVSFGLFQPVMDNIVPLYLYMNDLSFQAVTIVIVLVEFLKIIANYISQAMVRRGKAIILVITGFFLFMVSIISILFIKNSIALYIFSCTASVSFPLTFVPMFGLYCNYVKDTNNVFNGMTRRDFDIFSFRPGMYALSYLGFALYPCLIVGVIAVPIMLVAEIKLLKSSK